MRARLARVVAVVCGVTCVSLGTSLSRQSGWWLLLDGFGGVICGVVAVLR